MKTKAQKYTKSIDNKNLSIQQKTTKQFADNRPNTIVQRQIRANIHQQNNSPIQQQNENIVQRTVWKHDGTQWNVEVPKQPTDTDSFVHPNLLSQNPLKGAIYNQNTDQYRPSSITTALEQVGSSKGTLSDGFKRSTTGYGFSSGTNNQGQHTQSFISKKVIFGAGSILGRDLLKLKGSRIIPSPKKIAKRYKMKLKKYHRYDPLMKKKLARKMRRYNKQYKALKNGYNKKNLRLLSNLIEFSPVGTNNVDSGIAPTKQQIVGKGERRSNASSELLSFLQQPKTYDLSQSRLIDTNGLNTKDAEKIQKIFLQYSKFIEDDNLSDASDVDGSDDEFMDDLEE